MRCMRPRILEIVGPNHGPELLGAGGSDPTKFWAAESPQKWGRSRPSWCFGRVHLSPPSFTYLPFSVAFGLFLKVTSEVTLPLNNHVFASRHPISSYCRRKLFHDPVR